MSSKYEYDSATVQSFFDNYYHDRGKMKWQGFYLSDHTAALNQQMKQIQHTNKLRQEQTSIEITKLLMQSFTYNQVIKVQLNIYDKNNEVEADRIGRISGYDNDLFYLDSGEQFYLEDVRNVEFVM